MNKNRIIKAMPTVLFISGIVGIFVSEVVAARDTLKAEKVLYEKNFRLPDEPVKYTDPRTTCIMVPDKKTKVLEEVKATWKCYIPTLVVTAGTVSALVASNRLTAKQMATLSAAIVSTGSLVGKYREKIRDYANEEILSQIDKEVAEAVMDEAKPPVIETGHLLSTSHEDLSDDGEYIFFDPFTRMKFKSTKLAILGAKYYLNRNFCLGSEAPLAMFYAFLGLELPKEYLYAGWDVNEMSDSGYYWIDIDCVRSDKPDPDTGEYYYILEYDLLPGDCDDNYYPFGSPLDTYGSEVRA